MCTLHTDYSQVWGPECDRNILQGWYWFFLSSCYEFLSAPWLLQTFFWKVLSWTSISMASCQYIPIVVCLRGRSRTFLSKQDWFCYERLQELSSHVFMRSHFELCLLCLWLPAPLLAQQQVISGAPQQNVSCFIQLVGAGHYYCRWLVPEHHKMKAGYWKEHDYLTLTELLNSVIHSYQEWAHKTAVTL